MFRKPLVVILFLLLPDFARTDQQDSPDSIIDRAIEAHGGLKALAAAPAITLKGRGTFYGLGEEGFPFVGEWWIQGHNRFRLQLQVTIQGKQMPFLQVINGDRGWTRVGDGPVQAMKPDHLVEEKLQLHEGWVTRLFPLKDRGFVLTLIGTTKIDKSEAVGIKVSYAGYRDVRLYFDRKTGLLAKSEITIKNVKADGKEQTQETFYQDYKVIGGMKHPARVNVLRDGKRFVEGEFIEVRPARELPANLFDQP